ncbi:hypothetical protein D0T84_17430 [Dysgonomonas sp. 521]|uniref:hypothetical protein n=1 Tax=Dysgonomonas sp. 521 TaxID=2302932 RepID=UPI0013D74679|nr:hypothetical protein [Dysgonomonas sp. 521]NDV96681.1 hypothetical protein [Dysgonomonas sp. 521]
MNYEALYTNFLEEIVHKIPQKTRLVNILADILCISKEAVYRRLRGEMQFSFQEAMIISRELHIPLDTLETNNSHASKPFKLNLIEYINPAESDFALMEEMTEIMKSFKNIAEPEVGEITNILPQPLYVNYENIFRFYLFKWNYQTNNSIKATPYKDIIVLDKLKKTQGEYVKWAKRINTEYVFDPLLFQYLVTNIKYFYYVGLISHEDAQLIKQDLLKILDDIDAMSRTGIIKESGKKINIYISDVNVDTNYIYVATPDYHLTIIKVFLLNGIASTDTKTFEEVKRWMQSFKRQSRLITVSGEKERRSFLKEQHDLIDSLSQL